MKVNKILTRSEQKKILKKNGRRFTNLARINRKRKY